MPARDRRGDDKLKRNSSPNIPFTRFGILDMEDCAGFKGTFYGFNRVRSTPRTVRSVIKMIFYSSPGKSRRKFHGCTTIVYKNAHHQREMSAKTRVSNAVRGRRSRFLRSSNIITRGNTGRLKSGALIVSLSLSLFLDFSFFPNCALFYAEKPGYKQNSTEINSFEML